MFGRFTAQIDFIVLLSHVKHRVWGAQTTGKNDISQDLKCKFTLYQCKKPPPCGLPGLKSLLWGSVWIAS